MKRVAQSLARAEGRNIVKEEDLKRVRGILVDNLNEVLRDEQVRIRTETYGIRKASPRFQVVRATLINHPKLTVHEIWEYVKDTGLFKDVGNLQGLLDWMRKYGYVIETSDRRYEWV
ncbi:hypothetical protein DRP05_14960 [Archaeoglobales archaeon]|nr:MAG: hypothetical protein DRP05_14960 [Archaeoglobales archaeon]